MTKLKMIFLLLVFFTIAACGDDSVDCSDPDALITELNSEIDKVNNAAQAYANNPNDSGLCNNYKNALDNLIDYSQSLFDCTELNTAVIQTNIDQARTNLDGLVCN